MKADPKKTKVVFDFAYTMMASVVMNVVLQVIIYPIITRKFGASYAGEILYFVGLIYIFPQAVGTSIGNVRLMMRKSYDATNGDYNGSLVLLSVISSLICGAFAFWDSAGISFVILYGLFAFVYALRMYAQIEYRLKLKFSGYFFYYALVSAGYLIGFLLFFVTKQWLLIFLTGEIAGVIYALVRMDIFKREAGQISRKQVYRNISLLVFSTLARDGVNQFDRVILKQLLGSTAVTQYSAVSMIAKVIQMFVSPVNTLILSYLTVKDAEISVSKFKKYLLGGLGVGAFFYVMSLIGTPIFLKLFYSQLYDDIVGYSPIVNLGLILGFIASLYMAILLSLGKSGLYTAIQVVWGFSYIISSYYLTSLYSIRGMAAATVLVNIFKTVVAIGITLRIIHKKAMEDNKRQNS